MFDTCQLHVYSSGYWSKRNKHRCVNYICMYTVRFFLYLTSILFCLYMRYTLYLLIWMFGIRVKKLEKSFSNVCDFWNKMYYFETDPLFRSTHSNDFINFCYRRHPMWRTVSIRSWSTSDRWNKRSRYICLFSGIIRFENKWMQLMKEKEHLKSRRKWTFKKSKKIELL